MEIRSRSGSVSYESPYVEISSPGIFDDERHDSLDAFQGSVNSFLEEAEIIPPLGDPATLRAADDMRRKLRSFFMNPVEKWKKRGRFPWKFCVQIATIVLATIQMCLFGLHSFAHVQRQLDMTTALSRILLKDWSADPAVYPPSSGPYAVYTQPDFFEHANNVILQYTRIDQIAIGSYGYDDSNGSLIPVELCTQMYDGSVFAGNSSIKIEELNPETCIFIPVLYPSGDPKWDDFSLEDYLFQNNQSINFRTMVHAKIHLRLRTVFLKSASTLDFPECYRLHLMIKYDNSAHDGQMMISLIIRSTKVLCRMRSHLEQQGSDLSYLLRQLLNSSVILACVLSAILCLRSLHHGYALATETAEFFHRHHRTQVPFWELLDFIDFWYVNIATSDIMLVFGSLIKLQIEERSAEGSDYAKCSILLGVGNLLIWIGILRYLGFFPKYNMLILTLKRALPNVLRFLICAVFLFLGYCFCGWIVLAPYHIKFRTLSRTAECLFAIMNGDDMFATFALLDTNFDLIWWFTRFFLYSFLLLFVYIVVSLFISVIMDTFETIKHIYTYGAPPTTMVEIFLAAECFPTSPLSTPDCEPNCGDGVFKRSWIWLKRKCSYIFYRC